MADRKYTACRELAGGGLGGVAQRPGGQLGVAGCEWSSLHWPWLVGLAVMAPPGGRQPCGQRQLPRPL